MPTGPVIDPQVIFRTRPSLVLTLAGFWLFLLGAALVAFLLRDTPTLALGLGVGLGALLELIVLYVLVRNLTARYQMTETALTLRFRGKRARILISDIFSAECRQSSFQQMIGIGDVLVDATVNNELVQLRMRGIPDCHRRAEQIMQFVRNRG